MVNFNWGGLKDNCENGDTTSAKNSGDSPDDCGTAVSLFVIQSKYNR